MGKPPCLLLHGFTGGTDELEPLARELERCGRSCVLPLLPWNGRKLGEGGRVHWKDWVEAAEEEARNLERQQTSFDVVGFSMGGLLAAYMATKYRVRRLVLLNAAVIYISPARFARELTMRLRQGDRGHLEKMGGTPLQATWQFTRLVKHMRPELRKVKVPTLIAQSELDQVVHPFSARYVHSKLQGPKELHTFPRSNHLICQGPDAPELFRVVERFLAAD
ncbi:alpha/beta hydrolase [Paenibacillus chartarius]|uniref:Alpha/beta hydrolase n=1 Tax=Paenibacillus chartarius TaxID=747481 RepID=A0ABV6DPZ1_9BACL